jgi:hypothetical protein
MDLGAKCLVGELAHIVSKQNFVVAECDQRLGKRGTGSGKLGHRKHPSTNDWGKQKILSLWNAQAMLTV